MVAHSFFNVLSGVCCSLYLATAAIVERLTNLVDSFNGGTRVNPGKTLSCPLTRKSSPHMDYWINLPFFIVHLHRMCG